MIFGSDIPSNFWSHAARLAGYIRNRSPTRGNAGFVSPIFVLTDREPSISHILAFGTKCTVHTHSKQRGIVKRAEIGRIVGIADDTKGYEVWIPRLSKIVITRDVRNFAPPADTHEDLDVQPVETNFEKVKKTRKTKETTSTPIENEPRRSNRVRKPSKKGFVLMALLTKDPKSVKEALSGPNAAEWRSAMQNEIDQLIENGTWELVDIPIGTNIVSHRWVFRVKFDSEGEIEKFNARLVARGFSQQFGFDFTDTYSPVIRMSVVRFILIMAVLCGQNVFHSDVPQAYVRALIDTDIYMSIPALVDGHPKTQALKLLKGLYGLKQSGRLWHKENDATL